MSVFRFFLAGAMLMVPIFSSQALSFAPKEATAFDENIDTVSSPAFDGSAFDAPPNDSSFERNFDEEVEEAQKNKVAWPQATPAAGDFEEAAQWDAERFESFDRSDMNDETDED
jgi:hypothetical protein